MSFDVGVSALIYLSVYIFGGLMGLGTGAILCASGRSRLVAENAILRQRIAALSAQSELRAVDTMPRDPGAPGALAAPLRVRSSG